MSAPSPAAGAAAPDGGGERLLRLLATLFFFSGFPALLYQLTWQRALFRLFGVNIEAVTVVVAAFMLGLGLGALAGGALSRQTRLPLLALLAGIEGLTALYGFASLALFERAGQWLAGVGLWGTAAGALALVLLPTLLMGATLPVLVGHLSRRLGHVGRSTGVLYTANTLGAAAACFVAAALIFPLLGMSGAVQVAAWANVAVAASALAAWAWERRLPTTPAATAAPALATVQAPALAAAPAGAVLPLPVVAMMAAAVGYVSLSYEIVLFRTMSFASGNDASAFALTLGVFLAGIAAGSQRAGADSQRHAAGALSGRLLRMLGVANAAGALMLPALAHAGALGFGLLALVPLFGYGVARSWGYALPCVMHLGIAPDAHAGQRAAWVYLANIVGSVAGSIITGFIAMEHLSLVGCAQMLLLLGVACALAFAWRLRGVGAAAPLSRPAWGGWAVGAALGVAGALALPWASQGLLETLLWKDADPSHGGHGRFAQVVENRSGIITVDAQGGIYGHGSYDGAYSVDLVNDANGIVRPYALALFHAAPRRVLMIGLSSGSWAQVIANHPGVQRLVVLDINPGYEALAATHPAVASVLHNPRVQLIVDDGRRWLRQHPGERFDVIVSNTTFHHRAQITNLLSTEFMALVKARLAPGGAFFFNTTWSSRAQRTACMAFPHGARLNNHMVVSNEPIAWSMDRWLAVLRDYRIDGRPVLDAARPGAEATVQRLAAWRPYVEQPPTAVPRQAPIEHCPAVLARTAGEAIITDDNMGHEWPRFWQAAGAE